MIFSYHGAFLQNSLTWGIRQHTKTLTEQVTLRTIVPENTGLPWEDNRGKDAGVAFFISFPTTLKFYQHVYLPGFLMVAYWPFLKISTLPLRQE